MPGKRRPSFAVFHETPTLPRNGDPALDAYYDRNMATLRRLLDEQPGYLRGEVQTLCLPLCQLAARENRTDALELLIQLGGGLEHLQYLDRAGKNCLHTSIRSKALDAAKLLLENGFDPNERDREGQTPLHAACIVEDARFVRILIKAGADCNAKDRAGNLPIHQACQENQLKAVQLLLQKTSDINARGANNRTPLHYAALAQSLPLLKLLLRNSATVKAYDDERQSAMDIVLTMGNQNLLAGLSEYFSSRVHDDCDSIEELLKSEQFRQVLDILDSIDDDLENPLEKPAINPDLDIAETTEEEAAKVIETISSSRRIDFIEFRKMVIVISKEDLSNQLIDANGLETFARMVSKHVLFKDDAEMLNIIMFGTTLWPKVQTYLENEIQTMYEECSELGSTGMVALLKNTLLSKEHLWKEELMNRFFSKRLNLPTIDLEFEGAGKYMRNPLHSLTLWSVMSGRFNLTEDLLKGEQFDMLPIGLYSVCLLRKLATLKEIPRPTKKVMEMVADRVESVCLKLVRQINIIDTTEKKMVAINFIRLRLPLYKDFNCMGLASTGQCESFMVMNSVQAAVDREWYKRLYHSGSMYRELLVFIGLIPFNPLLFFLLRKLWIATCHLDSSNPEEIAHLERLEIIEVDEDDDESDEEKSEGSQEASASFEIKADEKTSRRRETVWSEGGTNKHGNWILTFLSLYVRTMVGFYFTPAVKFHYHILAHIIFITTFSYVMVAHFTYQISYAEIVVYLFLLGFFLEELHEINHARQNGSIFSYISDGWNILDTAGLLLSITGFCMRLALLNKISTEKPSTYVFTDTYYWWTRFVLQIASLVYWMRLLYVSTVMETLGPKLKMISVMITRDFVPFLIMLAIMMFGFGVVIYSLLFPNGFMQGNSVPKSASKIAEGVVRTTFYAMVGEDSMDLISGSDCSESTSCPHPIGKIVVPDIIMVLYIIIVAILLLNLIVASFSKTVNEIDKKSFAMWQFERYDLLEEFMIRSPLPPPLSIFGEIVRWGITIYEAIRHTEVILRRRSFSKHRAINFLTLQAFALRNRRKQLVGEVEVDDPEKLIPQMARRIKRLKGRLVHIKKRLGIDVDE